MDVVSQLRDRAATIEKVAAEAAPALAGFVGELLSIIKAGGTILAAGNGGSAAECQHLAAELVVRYRLHRRPLPAIALTTDTSTLTACGNDFSFADIFARQVEALGRRGDCLLLLSTSGRSENLIRAATAAAGIGLPVFALLGRGGGPLAALCQSAFVVPADDTAIIQEVHLAVIHLVCDAIDAWATAGGQA